MDIITWPEESQIKPRNISDLKNDPIYKYIKSLCYKTGVISSILYLLTLGAIRPALQRHYEQRQEFILAVLLRLRRTLTILMSRIKNKNVAQFKFNKEKTKVDRMIQTDLPFYDVWMSHDRMYGQRTEEDDEKSFINHKLRRINYCMNQHAIIMRHLDTTEWFTFQLKLLTDQVEASREKTIKEVCSKSENVTQSIREIKGWFVNGRIS